MKKILITGSNGFIGKNLNIELLKEKDIEIVAFTREDSMQKLEAVLPSIDFIYHLAGVNRPEKAEEFYRGNSELTEKITELIKKKNLRIPIVYSSSKHAEADSHYGISKKQAEETLLKYSREVNIPVFIYRLPNIFGKWAKPDYNSVVATFCYNISHGLDIKVSNPDYVLTMSYIDDVVTAFKSHLLENANCDSCYYSVTPIYKITVGELARKIYEFKNIKEKLIIPDLSDRLTKLLHATYLSYLNEEDFGQVVEEKVDQRGKFVELIKSLEAGQVSVSYSKPGIIRGNHYHHTKNEKFIVIEGKAKIRFRHILEKKVIEYVVSGNKLNIVDIPPGYAHSIENIGDDEMILLIWANECFDPHNPDTYYCEVDK
jgi:UDP-2-acetamido-2,6-beta-L-arabino-hexul-4-ose reductase